MANLNVSFLRRLATAIAVGVLFSVMTVGFTPASAADLAWKRIIDGRWHGDDEGIGVAVAADGSVYATGYLQVGHRKHAAWVAKFSPDGLRLWKRTATGPNGESTRGTAVALGPDGSVHVVGTMLRNAATNDSDVWMRTYSPDGQVLWTKTLDSAKHIFDMAFAVAAAPDGNLYVAGMAGGALWLGKFGPEGRRIWSRRQPHSGRDVDSAMAIATAPDGTIHVVGTLHIFHRSRQWLGVWSPDGELLRSVTDDALFTDGSDLVVDAAGNDWTVGTTNGVSWGSRVLRVAAFSPTGARLWTDVLSVNSSGCGLALAADGGVVAAGDVYAGTGYDLLLRRYTPEGALSWTFAWDGGGENSSESAIRVALAPDGGIIVAGTIEVNSSGSDILLAKFVAARVALEGP